VKNVSGAGVSTAARKKPWHSGIAFPISSQYAFFARLHAKAAPNRPEAGQGFRNRLFHQPPGFPVVMRKSTHFRARPRRVSSSTSAMTGMRWASPQRCSRAAVSCPSREGHGIDDSNRRSSSGRRVNGRPFPKNGAPGSSTRMKVVVGHPGGRKMASTPRRAIAR